jgi:cytochrome b561
MRRFANSSVTPSYTPTAVVLHWLIALLIVAGFCLGLSMVDLPLSPKKLKWFSWHKWIGISVFLLTVCRLAWRLGHRPPALPASIPPWQRGAAAATHVLLYLLTLVIPISGWLYSSAAGVSVVYLGLFPLPNLVAADKPLAEELKLLHEVLNYTLLTLVLLHVAAALKHQFIERDAVLARMLPFLRRESE